MFAHFWWFRFLFLTLNASLQQPCMPGGTKFGRNEPVPTELLVNPYADH